MFIAVLKRLLDKFKILVQ